jgi:hypothetical protein
MASMLTLAMRRMAFQVTTFRLSKTTTVQECFFYRMSMVTKAVASEILCTDWPALVTSTTSHSFFTQTPVCDTFNTPNQRAGGGMVMLDIAVVE